MLLTKGDTDIDAQLDSLSHYARTLVRFPLETMPAVKITHPDGTHSWGFQHKGWTHEDMKILGRYEAAKFTDCPVIYFQDDDVLVPREAQDALLAAYIPGTITCSMYDAWIEGMGYTDLAMVGLGAFVGNGLWQTAFSRWHERYGSVYSERLLLDPDFIFGTLTPFNRLDVGGEDHILTVASDPSRLSLQPGQHERKYETINMARDLRTVVCTIMAKDEQDNIVRALESTKNLYDSVLLMDTGSTDKTIQVTEDWCVANDKWLYVMKRPFDTFRESRQAMLEKGRVIADYQLLIDADEEWSESTRESFGPLWGDGYMLHYDGSIDYGQPRLIASRFPWKWTGDRHSYLDCEHPTFQAIVVNMKFPLIHHHGDERHGMAKVEADVEWLLEQIETTDDDLARNMFLLGKAYEGWKPEQAIHWYRIRAAMTTGDEESYWCKYRLGCLTCEVLNDMKTGIELLWEAYQDRPSRAEALRAAAFYLGAVADALPYPEDDYLLVSRNMYRV